VSDLLEQSWGRDFGDGAADTKDHAASIDELTLTLRI
jgi:hypothetical protein